ncbi:hypothetical protein HY383_02255 [Candidatus Daviesbacteria bacterium]|nr:hypothetical protein [Candidatus Daviesbacteria bacterium]
MYPVKNPEIVAQEQAAYTAKIDKNKAEGLKKIASGELPLFTGWSIEKHSGRTFDTILLLDEPSQKLVIERVVNPLRQLAEAHNITAVYPGIGDGPPHVVLQPGRFTNLDPEQMEAIKKYLASNNSHLNLLAKILEGLTFHHDTLVIAAPTTYVCAGKFDAEQGGVFRARRVMDRIIAHAVGNLKSTSQPPVEGNFTPNDYHDIFHSSVMRFTQEADPKDLIALAQEAYATLGEDLRRNPLPITIACLYRGMAVDYQMKVVPQWVTP